MLSDTPRHAWRLGSTILLLVASALLAPMRPAQADPADDLRLTFSSERMAGTPGLIVGTVRNRSRTTYPCIDAVFSLSTHFEDRQRGLPVRDLGRQAIRLRNLEAGSERSFQAPLRQKAGFGFAGWELCARPIAEGTPDPRPAPPRPVPPRAEPVRFCDVQGRIGSTLDFAGLDDRRRRETIQRVYILDAADRSLVKDVPLGRRTTQVRDHRGGRTRSYAARSYAVSGLREGQSYVMTLSRAWRTDPPEVVFRCPDQNGRYSLGLPTVFHVGNRLGG